MKMLLDKHMEGIDEDLRSLILNVSKLGIAIKDGFRYKQGKTDSFNIYGDEQVEMDRYSDRILVDGLKVENSVASIASEERDSIIRASDDGVFSVTFDPLDGSSLMGANWTVGTIVGIYRSRTPLRPGRELAAAMYILYGPLTILTYTIGRGVHEFVLDDEGHFVLQKENLMIGSGRTYGAGAPRKEWPQLQKKFVRSLEEEGYKLRFSGSFVSDVHRILHQGGIFSYPSYAGRPNGKLRLLFEANPMGFIVVNAGGAISNGMMNILDIVPERMDQRVPIYIGGKREVRMIEDVMKEMEPFSSD